MIQQPEYPIKMIAIDLDDTLIRDDTTVSDYTKDTIRRAQQKGIHIMIATGRMYATASPYGRMLGLGDIPMMLFGGGLIQTLESKKILYSHPIPQEDAAQLLSLAKEKGWMMQSYIDDVLRVAEYNHWVADYERITHSHAVVCGDDFYTPCGAPDKLLSCDEHEVLLQRAKEIEEAMPGRFDIMCSKPTVLEITPKGISKGVCLKRLCDIYGISLQNVMSFGNGMNDLSMLKAAGFGVAVANAVPEVREQVPYVTASNNEDGVARAIEKFIL